MLLQLYIHQGVVGFLIRLVLNHLQHALVRVPRIVNTLENGGVNHLQEDLPLVDLANQYLPFRVVEKST